MGCDRHLPGVTNQPVQPRVQSVQSHFIAFACPSQARGLEQSAPSPLLTSLVKGLVGMGLWSITV